MRLFASVVALAVVLGACGESTPAFDPKGVQLIVELKDYSVTPNVPTVKAGTLKIGVRNLASQLHEFVVLKTDLAPDKLPYDPGQAKAIETGLVGKIESIQPQRSAALTVTLEPGSYVIICNNPGHYQLGMRASLKAE
jgi:uncharacterized cupredoxin-like copper-binding protein